MQETHAIDTASIHVPTGTADILINTAGDPAGAGMILMRLRDTAVNRCLPRVSGDDPWEPSARIKATRLTPRERELSLPPPHKSAQGTKTRWEFWTRRRLGESSYMRHRALALVFPFVQQCRIQPNHDQSVQGTMLAPLQRKGPEVQAHRTE